MFSQISGYSRIQLSWQVQLTSTPMHIHFYVASNMAMYFLSFTLPFSFPSSLTSPDFFATKTSQNNQSIKQDTKNIIKNKNKKIWEILVSFFSLLNLLKGSDTAGFLQLFTLCSFVPSLLLGMQIWWLEVQQPSCDHKANICMIQMAEQEDGQSFGYWYRLGATKPTPQIRNFVH